MNKKLKLWELNRASEEVFRQQEKFPVIVVLDNIRSLSNIGSVFRTCDAFNITQLFLCGITACPPHREIQKTAIGATETVKWEHRSDALALIEELKTAGMKICCVEQTQHTTMLQDVSSLEGHGFVLIFGNEVDGVDQCLVDRSDYVIEIPQFGTKHSLNVSVCAGIVIWEFTKRFIEPSA